MFSIINKKMLSVLQIKPAEKTKVFWSSLQGFIIGFIQNYLGAIPLALFLTYFPSSALPEIYLAIAAVTVLCGLAYSYFERNLPFDKVVLGVFLILAITGLLFGVGLEVTNQLWIYAALTIWGFTAWDLSDLPFWATLNRIYTLEQGKRLFGVISASQSMGGLVAGLVLPLLVMFVDIKQLIIFLGILLFMALFNMIKLQEIVKKIQGKNVTGSSQEEAEHTIQFKQVFTNQYILKIFGIVVCSVFALFAIDMLFNIIAASHYPTVDSLAGFFSLFYGMFNAINLFINTVLYARLMRRFGLIFSLLFRPIIGIILAVILCITDVVPAFAAVVFGVMVTLKLTEDCGRYVITKSGLFLLMQPLSPNLRSFVQSKSDLIVNPFSAALISLLLMVINHEFGTNYLAFTSIAIVFYIIMLFIILSIKSDYIRALTNAIANRFYRLDTNMQMLDKDSLPLIKHYLLSPYPDEVIYALSIIEQAGYQELMNALGVTLKLPEPKIREYTLQKIKQYKMKEYYSEIIQILENDNLDTVRAIAFITAAHLNPRGMQAKIGSLMDDDLLSLRSAAIIFALQDHHVVTHAKALEKLQQMLASPDPQLRCCGADIIGEVNQEQTNLFIKGLVVDSDESVRSAAFRVVVKTQQTQFFELLLQNLHLIQFTGTQLREFIELKDKIIPLIQQQFLTYRYDVQIKLLYVIGSMDTNKAREFLEEVILGDSLPFRQIALRSLAKTHLHGTPDFLKSLAEQIIQEALNIEEYAFNLSMTPQVEFTLLFRDVLQRIINLSLERLLLSLSLYYYDKPISRAATGLKTSKDSEISYALELIDSSIEPQHKKVISPILSKVYFSNESEPFDLESEQFAVILKKYLKHDNDEQLNVLACLASIYIVKHAKLQLCYPDIELLKNARSDIIHETIEWLEKTINVDKDI